MKIVVKIFNCNYETYKKYYKDAVKRAFKKDGIDVNPEDITVAIDELPGDTIQSQRAPSGRHSRTITVLVDDIPTYIIGFSNTGFDEDRKVEADKGIKPYIYGYDYINCNTFICLVIYYFFVL